MSDSIDLQALAKSQGIADQSEDKKLIDFLEEVHGLHTEAEILYVVDGYIVTIRKQEADIMQFTREDLREALSSAMEWWEENKYEVSPHRFKREKDKT